MTNLCHTGACSRHPHWPLPQESSPLDRHDACGHTTRPDSYLNGLDKNRDEGVARLTCSNRDGVNTKIELLRRQVYCKPASACSTRECFSTTYLSLHGHHS